MGIRDALEADKGGRRYTCKVQTICAAHPDLADDILWAIYKSGASARRIAAALWSEYGIALSYGAVTAHMKGECLTCRASAKL